VHTQYLLTVKAMPTWCISNAWLLLSQCPSDVCPTLISLFWHYSTGQVLAVSIWVTAAEDASWWRADWSI